jgi:hypothetical protein
MGSITPSAPTIGLSASQALVAAGVSSPKWWQKSGGGSLGSISGSNATYTGPGSATTAVIRAEEEFWLSGTGTSESDNSLTLPASSYGTKQAVANLETANYTNAKVTFIANSGFLSNAYNSVGFTNGVGSANVFLMGDGKVCTGSDATGVITTITLATNDVVEFKLVTGSGGNFSVEIRINGTLADTLTDHVFFYNSGNVMHLYVGTYGGPGYNLPHPELSTNWTGWSYGESIISVSTAPPADMVLGTPVVINAVQINVPFTEDAGFDFIKVQRCENNTFSGPTLVEYDNQPADSPFVNDDDLNPSETTTYFYRAKAKDSLGVYSANWSNIVSVELEIPLVAEFTVPAELEWTDPLIPTGVSVADEYEWKVNGEIVSTDSEPDLTLYLVMVDRAETENVISLKITKDDVESDPTVKTVNVVEKIIYVPLEDLTLEDGKLQKLLEDLTEGLTVVGDVQAVDVAGNKSGWSNQATATVGSSGDIDGFFLTEDGGDFITEDGGDFIIIES